MPTMHCGVRADPGKLIEQYRETPQLVARPLLAGFYWYRQIVTQKSTKRIKRADIKSDWTVMHVHGDEGALQIDWGDWSESLKHFVRTTPHNVRYEWIGPLLPPNP